MADIDAGMTWWEFAALLAGLSADSAWRHAVGSQPVEVTGEAARALIANM